MNSHYFKFRILLGVVSFVFCLMSCTPMDDSYKDFWNDGEKVYPASPDSVKVYPGKNRIKLEWLIIGDPSVKKAVVLWNNGKSSWEVPVEMTGLGTNTVTVILTGMEEGFYIFDIYSYDDKGNSSVKASAAGTVYGDAYINVLFNRPVREALLDAAGLNLLWGPFPDETSLGTELAYIDILGLTRNVFAAPDAETTILDDYDYDANEGFIHSRTMYMPDTMAIDTFYTAYDPVKVIGPPVPYSTEGWTITASSFRAGDEPENLIDGNPATLWINRVGDSFPFIITVDMGMEKYPVDGVFLQQRVSSSDPRLQNFELQISTDGITWKSVSIFEMTDDANVQYFDFPEPENLRYFQIICNSVFRDRPNCSLAEIGIYHR